MSRPSSEASVNRNCYITVVLWNYFMHKVISFKLEFAYVIATFEVGRFCIGRNVLPFSCVRPKTPPVFE